MDVKVNNISQVTQVPDTQKTTVGDGSFKFTLSSAITDAELQAKVDSLMEDITAQGNRIAQHMDIRDMKKYRGLIKDFLNEVVYRLPAFCLPADFCFVLTEEMRRLFSLNIPLPLAYDRTKRSVEMVTVLGVFFTL